MKKIHVTFIDAANNNVLGKSDIPADQLPETFALSTTLHLGPDDWQVSRAVPVTRDEYVKSGQLHLELRRVQMIDPHELLFSLATIDDMIPPCRPANGSDAYEIDEDEWRQLEFVSSAFLREIEAEFADVRAIHDARVGMGFKTCHVRKRIPDPLAGVSVDVATIHALLGDFDRLELAIGGPLAGGALVVGGFAFDRLGTAVYGREVDGRVAVIGLEPAADPFPLRGLARDEGLLLVDWVRARIVNPDGSE
jgi:hypothetical protein